MIPEQPVGFWQYFDVYTLSILAIVIASLSLSYHRRNGSLLRTISETVAHSKTSSLIFSIAMTVCYPLYYAFIWFWVAPLLEMPSWFYVILLVSAICEAVFVWVPASQGRQKRVHQVAAGIVGLLILIMPILIFLFGKNLNTASVVSIIIFLIYSAIVGGLVIIKRYRKHTFAFEVVYMVIFLSILSIIAHS